MFVLWPLHLGFQFFNYIWTCFTSLLLAEYHWILLTSTRLMSLALGNVYLVLLGPLLFSWLPWEIFCNSSPTTTIVVVVPSNCLMSTSLSPYSIWSNEQKAIQTSHSLFDKDHSPVFKLVSKITYQLPFSCNYDPGITLAMPWAVGCLTTKNT
jgi:hypothetical protein